MEKIKNYIFENLEKKGALLAALIDPLDYPSIEKAIFSATKAAEGGADYILIGGSIGVGGELLDTVCKEIKSIVSIPVVLFPGNISTISKYADALYFMSLLNSSNPYWISGAQMLAAFSVQKAKLEPLSVAYLVVEPGGTVGWVGDAKLIPRNKPYIAASFAKAAEFLGMDFVLTDCGSNSNLGPIPTDFIRVVANSISIPYIVAGGIRTPLEAKEIIKAGASIIQVGTILEKEKDPKKIIESFCKAMRQEAKPKNFKI
jgi:phosphoglycerol geranylgeranyltransferase